jgi:hypothetical protein
MVFIPHLITNTIWRSVRHPNRRATLGENVVKTASQFVLFRHPGPIEELWNPTEQKDVIDNPLRPVLEVGGSGKIIDKVMIAKRQVDRQLQMLNPGVKIAFKPSSLKLFGMIIRGADIASQQDPVDSE